MSATIESASAAPLQMIGFWKDRIADAFPLPMELEAPQTLASGLLADFLDAGVVAERWRGMAECRYECEGYLGSTDLSDGVWLWPEGLAHYVRYHAVALPPSFVEHVLRRPAISQLRTESLGSRSRSNDSWTTWAAQYRTTRMTARLGLAEEQATRTCEEALQAHAAKLITERGLSTGGCLSIGCERFAISGMAICANCVTEERRAFELYRCEGAVLRQIARESVSGLLSPGAA